MGPPVSTFPALELQGYLAMPYFFCVWGPGGSELSSSCLYGKHLTGRAISPTP